MLRLTSETETMLEEALSRLRPLVGDDHLYISTSLDLKQPLGEANLVVESNLIAEPAKRNTLGALCWLTANLIAQGHGDAIVAVVTADHRISESERFRATVQAAFDIAEDHGGIVTIGVPPDRPETGYGYIEVRSDGAVSARDGRKARIAAGFREKPTLETALSFLEAGNFFWNSGMFIFSLREFMKELEAAQPDAHAITVAIAELTAAGEHRAAAAKFEELPSISVDYAVMEKAKRVYTIEADFPWDDVGAWDAIERSFAADVSGNVIQGNAVVLESEGCIVVNNQPGSVVGILGLTDVVVVTTGDAVLVCPKDKAQLVRNIARAVRDQAVTA